MQVKSEVTSGQGKGKKKKTDIYFLAWECLAFKFQEKISCSTCLFFGIYFSCSCTSLAISNKGSEGCWHLCIKAQWKTGSPTHEWWPRSPWGPFVFWMTNQSRLSAWVNADRFVWRTWSYPLLCVSSKVTPKSKWAVINLDPLCSSWGFSGGSAVKNRPPNAGDTGSMPGLRRSPGEGNSSLLQYSCLGKLSDRRSLAGYSPRGHKSQTWPSN